jgi:hypothetical protein
VTPGRTVGELYAFVGLERAASVTAFRIDGPRQASYAGLIAAPGDDAPEIFVLAPAADAPGGAPVLFAANEMIGNSRTFALGGPEGHWHL